MTFHPGIQVSGQNEKALDLYGLVDGQVNM